MLYNRVIYYYTWIFLILLPHPISVCVCMWIVKLNFISIKFKNELKGLTRLYYLKSNSNRLASFNSLKEAEVKR